MTSNLFEKYKHSKLYFKPNYLKIPVTNFKFNEEGIQEFNAIYTEVLNHKDEYHKIVRTPSGGISFKNKNFIVPCYDVQCTNATVELTIINHFGMYRFLVGMVKEESSTVISGGRAFNMLKHELLKDCIDLNDYAITPEEGVQAKSEIEKPLICRADETVEFNKTYEHCYHADYHESYGTGLALTHPEFRKTFERLHNERVQLKHKKSIAPLTDSELKRYETIKAMFTHSVGMMQSVNVKTVNAKWAHLSRDAINNNKQRIQNLAYELKQNGYKLLLFNTDGIWYQDLRNKGAYKNATEGDELGNWYNDHLDCTLRMKSAGSYEFIENGKYTPVVRGSTKLDRIKPRDEWTWGDIFQEDAEIIKFGFDPDFGVFEAEVI